MTKVFVRGFLLCRCHRSPNLYVFCMEAARPAVNSSQTRASSPTVGRVQSGWLEIASSISSPGTTDGLRFALGIPLRKEGRDCAMKWHPQLYLVPPVYDKHTGMDVPCQPNNRQRTRCINCASLLYPDLTTATTASLSEWTFTIWPNAKP